MQFRLLLNRHRSPQKGSSIPQFLLNRSQFGQELHFTLKVPNVRTNILHILPACLLCQWRIEEQAKQTDYDYVKSRYLANLRRLENYMCHTFTRLGMSGLSIISFDVSTSQDLTKLNTCGRVMCHCEHIASVASMAMLPRKRSQCYWHWAFAHNRSGSRRKDLWQHCSWFSFSGAAMFLPKLAETVHASSQPNPLNPGC